MNRTCGWLSVASVSVGVLVCARAVVGQPLTYRVVEVPQLPSGDFVNVQYVDVFDGRAYANVYDNVGSQAFVLRNDGLSAVTPLSGYQYCGINGTNRLGDFVGSSQNSAEDSRSTLWFAGQTVDANQWAGRSAWFYDVNNARTFCGSVRDEFDQWQAATFSADGVSTRLDVPDDCIFSASTHVNDADIAAGVLYAPSTGHQIVRWSNGVREPLAFPATNPDGVPMYYLSGINASGDVLGYFHLHLGQLPQTTGFYLWRGGDVIQLTQGLETSTRGLADHGGVAVISGDQSWLWFEGVNYTPDQFHLLDFDGVATDILRLGSDGSMVARVQDAQGERIAILTLVPSPGSLVLVVAGLGAVARRRRGD